MSFGKQLNLFLVDGTPGGLLTAEIGGWTGHITAAPRTKLAELLKREEAARTGVYLLLGDDPEAPDSTRAYIGEGDEIGTRIKSHALPRDKGGKDFWQRAILMTSKDANLTKAHVLYLEARLIEMAKNAQRSAVENSQAPDRSQRLPESDIAVMEAYLAELGIVLPMLGINVFRQPSSASPETPPRISPQREETARFYLHHKTSGRIAHAQEHDGEFTVLKGSQAAKKWLGAGKGYSKLHSDLIAEGTLKPHPTEDYAEFIRDKVLSSVSAAGAVINGRPTNGRTEWKHQGTDTTYAQWQSAQIEELPQDQ